MNKLWHSLVAFIRNLGYAVRRFYLDLLLQKAHKQIDFGKYHEALKSVKNAQRLIFSDPEVLYTLGLIYYLLDDYGQSIRYFDQTLQINSSHHLAKAWQGWAYWKQGLTIQAEQQFKQVIQVISSTYLDCMAKGIASNGLEQYDESIKYFREATKYQPKSHQAWNSYAYALHYAGQYENAVDGFCEAIRLFKKYPRAWRGKGLSLSMLEVYEKSLESFEEAIKLKDDFYQAWIGKSISLANMADISSENRQNARYCAKKAIEIKPSYSRTYFLQGLMLSILKENEEAIASYNQAIALQANYPEAYYRKGLALVHLDGRYEEAIKSFEKAVDLQENYTEAYYQIALIYQRLSASQKAIRYYEKIIELQPSYLDVWEKYLAGLSTLVKLSGFKGTVISSCNKILKLNPQCYELHRIKADALMGLAPYKNAREALLIYDNAIGYGDESAEVWFGKGKAEEQLKLFHKAVVSYKKALKIREDYWEAYDNMGWVVLQLSGRDGGLKEALKVWERGLNCLQGNKTEFAKEIRGQLYYSIGRAKHNNNKLEAKANYNKSIKEYQTIKNFSDNRFIREKHLEVLMDLIQVSRDLKEHLKENNEQYKKYKKTLEIAEKFVDSLIDVTDFPEKKLQLKRKFEGIYQFHVDQYVESGFFKEALELAEERKNVYLRWFYKSNWEEHNKLIINEFKLKLKPKIAIIYWHISPEGITTFILKNNEPVQVIKNDDTIGIEPQFATKHNRPQIKYNRLKRFEEWMTKWRDNYFNYRGKQKEKTIKKNASIIPHPQIKNDNAWRDDMEFSLIELSEILNISGIIQSYLTNEDQLILVPHRDLHLLPLHALFFFPYSWGENVISAISNSFYLISICENYSLFKTLETEQISLSLSSISSNFLRSQLSYSISYLPSIQAATHLRKSSFNSSYRLLSVEEPNVGEAFARLDAARIECEAITSFFNEAQVTRIEGDKATKEMLKDKLKENLEILHFTGHSQHDVKEPLRSALFLASTSGKPYDRLTLDEILKMSLESYYLVCLSGCETGMTSSANIIDEFVGLGSGFLAKGIPYVVTTLWTVEDTASSLVMIKFYHLLKKNLRDQRDQKEGIEILALRDAQIWLRNLTYRKLIRLCKTFMLRLSNDSLVHTDLANVMANVKRRLERKGENPSDCPYADPYYWAAFTITGVPPLL